MFRFVMIVPASYLTFPLSVLGYILLMLITWAAFGLNGMVLTVLGVMALKVFSRM